LIQGIVNQDALKLYGTRQLMVYFDYVNIMDESVHIVEKNSEAFVVAIKRLF
jgi:hypothetical protein